MNQPAKTMPTFITEGNFKISIFCASDGDENVLLPDLSSSITSWHAGPNEDYEASDGDQDYDEEDEDEGTEDIEDAEEIEHIMKLQCELSVSRDTVRDYQRALEAPYVMFRVEYTDAHNNPAIFHEFEGILDPTPSEVSDRYSASRPGTNNLTRIMTMLVMNCRLWVLAE